MTLTRHKLIRITLWTCYIIASCIAIVYFILWRYNVTADNPLPFNMTITNAPIIASDQMSLPIEKSINILISNSIQPPLELALQNIEKYYPNLTLRVEYNDDEGIIEQVKLGNSIDVVLGEEMLISTINDIVLDNDYIQPIRLNTTPHITNNSNDAESHPVIFNFAKLDSSKLNSNFLNSNDIESDDGSDPDTILQGIILLNSHNDISFNALRQYLLASYTQDIFRQSGYRSIEPYQNKVGILFNPNNSSSSDNSGNNYSSDSSSYN